MPLTNAIARNSIKPFPAFISEIGPGRTELPVIADLSERAGAPLLPWQALVAHGATERRSTGRTGAPGGIPGPEDRWRWPLVSVTVPRQAGKTHLLGLVLIARCLEYPGSQCWYSAQTRGDALLRWREFVRLIERMGFTRARHIGSGQFTEGGFRVRSAVGDESIDFDNGSSIRIFAPQEDSLHGSVTDLVVLDEVRFHDLPKGDGLLAAVLPSQVTRDGQVWIVSTSGDGRAAFLAKMVERGRQATETVGAQQFHAEWAIPEGVEDGALYAAVCEWHPAYGHLLRDESLRLAYDQMSAIDFAREYGNRWVSEVSGLSAAIAGDVWSATSTQVPLPDGAPVFGVDVALDRSAACITACVGGVLEVVDTRPGAAWLPARLRALCASWPGSVVVVDGLGPAATVAEALAPELGAALVVCQTRQVVGACGAFYDGLHADPPSVWHREHPALDEGAACAEQRKVGQAWAWSRTAPSGPVLMSATLAWWAWATNPVALEAPQIW